MRNNRSKTFKKRRDDEIEAQVVAIHGAGVYEMELSDGKTIKGHLSGRMKKNKISLIVGDRVKVVLDPYGGNATNRVTYRL